VGKWWETVGNSGIEWENSQIKEEALRMEGRHGVSFDAPFPVSERAKP
jgi:hypothetical protein